MHLSRKTVYKEAIQAFASTIAKHGDDPNYWPLSVRLTVARLVEIHERHQEKKTTRFKIDGRISVFLSCSREFKVQGDKLLYEIAREEIEKRCGVHVVIGNDEPEGKWLEETVRLQIENSDAFVAVLTKDEMSGQIIEDGQARFIPSPWIIFELGIAFALHKPFTIVRSEEISKNYRSRLLTANDFIDSSDFENEYADKLVEATQRAIRRYGLSLSDKMNEKQSS